MSANKRAEENRRYVRERLAERQPAVAAALRTLERRLDWELAHGAHQEPPRPGGLRRAVNTAWLYHPDSSVCVDHRLCQERDHTSITPRCAVGVADHGMGCELPQGHPGPHVHAADRPHGGQVQDGAGVRLPMADNPKDHRDRHRVALA